MAGTVKDINDAMAIMWEWAEDMVCDVVIDNPDYTLRDVSFWSRPRSACWKNAGCVSQSQRSETR